jgi:hypothetical protein
MTMTLHRRSALLMMLICAAVFTTAAYPLEAPKAIGKRAVIFTLEDQFEKSWSWESTWSNKPVVLVMSDWKGSNYTTNWTTTLARRFKDRVDFVAMADVSLAPGFLKGMIRSKFREAYKIPILLDWDGDVFKHYNFQAGLPNVIYVDNSETVRLHTWGSGQADHVERFATELERLLAKH